MESTTPKPFSHVAGLDGEVLTLANLPAPDTVRWVPRRKATLVAAVCGGLISLDEVCQRYGLTPEEFTGWKNALDAFGMKGLLATRPRQRRRVQEGDSRQAGPAADIRS